MKSLHFINLNDHAIVKSIGEAREKSVLWIRRLEGQMLAHDLLSEKVEQNALAAALFPVQENGHLSLFLRSLNNVRQPVQYPLCVCCIVRCDHVVDMLHASLWA